MGCTAWPGLNRDIYTHFFGVSYDFGIHLFKHFKGLSPFNGRIIRAEHGKVGVPSVFSDGRKVFLKLTQRRPPLRRIFAQEPTASRITGPNSEP